MFVCLCIRSGVQIEDGQGGVTFEFGSNSLLKNKGRRIKKRAPAVAESHLAEDLLTEFTHPKFHVGRVLELFAEIEAAAEANTTTTRKQVPRKKKTKKTRESL